jgi:hypothetical protein
MSSATSGRKNDTDPGVASLCRPDEWLLVEAWDES